MTKSPIKLYWWNGSPNFGDMLSALLIKRLLGRESIWSDLVAAELTGCGSLLQWITPVQTRRVAQLAIWGSGFIFADEPPPELYGVHYYAVRGAQSASLAGLTPNLVPLGDPGLLASQVVRKSALRRSVGLVPHLWHRDGREFSHLATELQGAVLIDVAQDPETVLEAISSCELIVSSSLHGLVVADSYGIPSVWASAAPNSFGGRYKFDDYYSAFNAQRSPLALSGTTRSRDVMNAVQSACTASALSALQEGLLTSFPDHLR